MADGLYELLAVHDNSEEHKRDDMTVNYLNRLSTLSATAITGAEVNSLEHEEISALRSIQALAKRSYKSIDTSVDSLARLGSVLPALVSSGNQVKKTLPALEHDATFFTQKYSRATENATLERRKSAMRMGDNVDRLTEILELPTLLASTIVASSGSVTNAAGAGSSATANYASALDLYAHTRRLHRLYPDSPLITSTVYQAEEAMKTMTTNLITSLRSQSLKLAGGMRLIGLLRRIAPELEDGHRGSRAWAIGADEESYGALFLICRLANFMTILGALDPLKELADQEGVRQNSNEQIVEKNVWAAGQQTERYLKRYVEVFREQCFSTISMYKSIFPASLPPPNASEEQDHHETQANAVSEASSKVNTASPPPALATFTAYVVELLFDTLNAYLPNIRDRNSRDSLLTQVLYCAASLGRLGGDFSMMLSMLDEVSANVEKEGHQDGQSAMPEWMYIMKKHRVQAGRLEVLASGAKSTKAGSDA